MAISPSDEPSAVQAAAGFDVFEAYKHQLSSHDPPISPALAGVLAITSGLAEHDIRTAAEGFELLARLTTELKQHVRNGAAIIAGTEDFQQQLVKSVSSVGLSKPTQQSLVGLEQPVFSQADFKDASFVDMKRAAIESGRTYVAKGLEARKRIARFGRRLIRDGTTVVTVGSSKVVSGLLEDAMEAQINFRVVIVEQKGESAVAFEGSAGTYDIPIARIGPEALGRTLTDLQRYPYKDRTGQRGKTLVLSGASAVLTDGSIVSSCGTLQAASLARQYQMEFCVAAEVYKGVHLFQHDAILRIPVFDESGLSSTAQVDSQWDVVDQALIAKILTEHGPWTTTEMSMELSKKRLL